MKKLLAILLTLALMLPLCGLAEETAPQATRTVIFLKDFNAKVLGADIDEAEEKAVNDFLDALRVIVYQQGTTSAAYEVTLNDQPIVDYAVQFSGADVYVSSDLLGETLYLNLDEDMQHFGELVYRQRSASAVLRRKSSTRRYPLGTTRSRLRRWDRWAQ